MGDVYVVSEEEKDEWECLGNALADLAAIWAGWSRRIGSNWRRRCACGCGGSRISSFLVSWQSS